VRPRISIPVFTINSPRFALQPESTVFIDDRAENIEAVRQRGWHGIIHVSHDQTIAALLALGVAPE